MNMNRAKAEQIVSEFLRDMNPHLWDGKKSPKPTSFDDHPWEYPLSETVNLEITFAEDDGWRCCCDLVDSQSNTSFDMRSCSEINSAARIANVVIELCGNLQECKDEAESKEEKFMKEVLNWKYIEKEGNPTEAGFYLVTVISPERENGKETGRKFATVELREFADLDKDPDAKLWVIDKNAKHGLAWLTECGSALGEQIYAWEPLPEIAVLPEGVLAE